MPKDKAYKFRRDPFQTLFNPRHPRVKEKKLGKEHVWGLAYMDEGYLEIDPRLGSKDYLDTLIHEMLHCYLPELEEEDIDCMATKMANQIWRKGYRRIQQ